MRSSLTAFSGFLLLGISATVLPTTAQTNIFLTPVPNAAFTAVVEVQRTRIRPDGSVFSLKSIRNMARDGIGRIHNESRTFVPATSTTTPEIVHIHLYDPRTRVSTELDARTRTVYTETMSHPALNSAANRAFWLTFRYRCSPERVRKRRRPRQPGD